MIPNLASYLPGLYSASWLKLWQQLPQMRWSSDRLHLAPGAKPGARVVPQHHLKTAFFFANTHFFRSTRNTFGFVGLFWSFSARMALSTSSARDDLRSAMLSTAETASEPAVKKTPRLFWSHGICRVQTANKRLRLPTAYPFFHPQFGSFRC